MKEPPINAGPAIALAAMLAVGTGIGYGVRYGIDCLAEIFGIWPVLTVGLICLAAVICLGSFCEWRHRQQLPPTKQ